MIASSWWKVGFGMVGAASIFASSGTGCGSSTSSSTGDTTSATSGGGNGTGTGTSGTGGNSTTGGVTTTTGGMTTTTSGGMTTTSASSTSSTGTGSPYTDCQACTDLTAGAPTVECKAAYDACFGDPNCKQIYNCANAAGNGCSTDAAGACCTFACFDALKATLPNDPAAVQKAKDRYHAYDSCLYCTTCKAQCSADAYCTAYAAGPGACPP